jgi:hypothetical protein
MQGETMNKTESPVLNPLIDWATMPWRIRELPIGPNGYPVPWFVAWVDGVPEFRASDLAKWVAAVRRKQCWVCGGQLGSRLAFVLGPMCIVTRTTSEPPSHRECAEWSIRNCPFLTRPHMHRRTDRLPEDIVSAPGHGLERNPGVAALWITRGYSLFDDGNGRKLIRVDDPCEPVEWFAEGRAATRAEVLESLESGMPSLEKIAQEQDHEAFVELAKQHKRALAYLPVEGR